MAGFEWFGADGSSNGSSTYNTGSEDCWLVIHGSDNLAWNQFDAHKVGWIVAGAFALVATIISGLHIAGHLKHYTVPRQQRHIVRIILMIAIYSIISFLSYRFYREAPYYLALRDCYEAFVIASFYMLLLQYIGDSSANQKRSMLGKSSLKWTFPFNCFMMNPASPRTFVLLKWGILQYVIIRPLGTLATIITHAKGVFCPSSMSPKYAHLWITAVFFVSVSVAMYALVSLYRVIKDDIKEQKPFIKFVAIKAIVFLTFWEGFVISLLGSNSIHVIKETKYWSSDNVVDGLTALVICIEMALFAVLFIKAFPIAPYKRPDGTRRTPMRRAFVDSLNFGDFFVEIWYTLKWLAAPLTGKQPAEPDTEKGRFGRMDINGAARYNINKRIDSAEAEELGEAMPLTQLSHDVYPPSAVAHNGMRMPSAGQTPSARAPTDAPAYYSPPADYPHRY
ncbi:hypothetical protein GGI02_000196 [Coemansia sp. RSA 2322]|uniref:DUF300-domain-containing protein n=1 Tax=Coemansia thaxteri TaxID=2663907 RepID=A0A9W8EHK8_9FUNG|nr:hypothetical protein H4R26_004418 [Coemansia thaxteri]KAJ2474303.1 hypothetical protein GGI02_000196 [Coemansia sp. RSA 2322]KAJ2484194.1 hypothetical protein EV174_002633 [Coemansia sp. RSA 2320]